MAAVPKPANPAQASSSTSRWRIATFALAILALVLGGLLVKATRPAPTHAAQVYTQWMDDMLFAASKGRPVEWSSPAEIARSAYAYNGRALGMIGGIYAVGNPSGDFARMVAYLFTASSRLDEMLQSTLNDQESGQQRRDARYVRTVVQHDILGQLPRSPRGDVLVLSSDDRAIALTPKLCRIAATVEIRFFQRFIQNGPPDGLRSELRHDCAAGLTFP